MDGHVETAFPEPAGRVACSGSDRLGRQWARATATGTADDRHVLLLNPSTAEVSPNAPGRGNPSPVPPAFDECVTNRSRSPQGAERLGRLVTQELPAVWGTRSRLLSRLR